MSDRYIITNAVKGGIVCYNINNIGNGQTHLFRCPPERDTNIVPLSFALEQDAWNFIKQHRSPRDYNVLPHSVWDEAVSDA